MEEIISILRNYREMRGISYDELSRRTGIPKSTLHRYETNSTQKLDISAFFKIASALGIPISALYGAETQWIDTYAAESEALYRLPVIGKVCAGNGILAQENIIGYEGAEKKYHTGEYFYLQVKGDSMSPRLDSGDLVLVRKQSTIDDGDVGIIVIDGEEGMIKKVRYEPDRICLVSFNPYYPDLCFERREMNRIQIIGKVVESKRKW